MDHPLPARDLVRPWRTATIVASAVAAVELVLLVVLGGTLLAKSIADGGSEPRKPRAAARKHAVAPVREQRVAPAKLTRRKVSVLVLNGNGRQGAAAAAASRVGRKGYRIDGVANAPSSDYARSIVMYRAGFAGEGHRLARDLGIRLVGPLDGLRRRDLHGAHAVLVVGA